METFTWPLRISSMDGQHSLDIEATVEYRRLLHHDPRSPAARVGY